MKYLFIILFSFSIFTLKAETPADIHLKSGKTIHAHHFGQLTCNGTRYFKNFIMIKGKYEGVVSEIKEYHDIKRIDLLDFEEPPLSTGENERGKISIEKKNGISFILDDAEITLSCYGVDEKYNQLQVQIINPVTEKPTETTIDTQDIDYILFK
jgi:hypothetical protein